MKNYIPKIIYGYKHMLERLNQSKKLNLTFKQNPQFANMSWKVWTI